jgi:hypothetical protein
MKLRGAVLGDWIIVTSMRWTRLYHKGFDQQTYELFDTERMADDATLRRFVFLLGADRVVPTAGRCHFQRLSSFTFGLADCKANSGVVKRSRVSPKPVFVVVITARRWTVRAGVWQATRVSEKPVDSDDVRHGSTHQSVWRARRANSCTEASRDDITDAYATVLRPLSGSIRDCASVLRGCRFAQPPANRYDPCRGQISSVRSKVRCRNYTMRGTE